MRGDIRLVTSGSRKGADKPACRVRATEKGMQNYCFFDRNQIKNKNLMVRAASLFHPLTGCHLTLDNTD